MLTLETGESEGSVTIGLNLGVDIGTAFEEDAHSIGVAVHRSQHQGGNAKFGTGAGVDFGSVTQEEVNYLDETPRSGQAEWSVVGEVSVLFVGTAVKKILRNLYLVNKRKPCLKEKKSEVT